MHFRFSTARHSSGPNEERGMLGKIGISLFLSLFLAAGLFFFYMLSLEVLDRAAVYQWDKSECFVHSSSIEEQSGDNPYLIRVLYSYRYQGVRYENTQISKEEPSYDKYTRASKALAPYKQDTPVDCYVNPEAPSEAVLSRDGLWIAFFLLLPLVFIGVGGGGIYGVWSASSDTGKSRGAKRATSRDASSGSNTVRIIGAIFFLVGVGIFYPFVVVPLWNIYDAQSWVPTECTVISSYVKSHDSDDGTTYSVEILYRYMFNGENYKSDRYEFFGGSSSGYDGKKQIVKQHPRGKTFTCYVDPDTPSEAVIHRGLSWMALLGLLPLFFIGFGLLMMTISKKSEKKKKSLNAFSSIPRESGVSAGPLELKPASSRMTKLFGITFAALFWNGIVSVFLYEVWESWNSGSLNIFLTVFLIPFVLIGIALLFGILHSFLSLFNPLPIITLENGKLVLGGEIKLRWQIQGKAERLAHFSIRLEGGEEATYTRGTDTYTAKSTFYRQTLYETSRVREMVRGEATVQIPKDAMHTFASSNNKIVWKIVVVGDIPKWPDINREHIISIGPMEEV